MKIEIDENKFGMNITLTPENLQEMAQLLRASKNAAAVKPDIYTTLSDQPYCNIWIRKVKDIRQSNNVKPSDR
jgi:hypothetical protein